MNRLCTTLFRPRRSQSQSHCTTIFRPSRKQSHRLCLGLPSLLRRCIRRSHKRRYANRKSAIIGKTKVRSNLDRWLAGARVRGSAAVHNFRELAKSTQKKFAVLNLKSWDGTASRLWIYAGVAALSAVLVVGVISGVRHYAYAPDTPQPRSRNTSPVSPAMQAISQPRPSPIVATNGAAATQHPARSSAAAKHAAAKHAPAEHAATKAGSSKIRRKNRDDDYVAKDTFVSYDSKGKPTR